MFTTYSSLDDAAMGFDAGVIDLPSGFRVPFRG
jgi:hypothetical protein